MEKIKILSLHGFLGLPTDWDLIQSYFMVSPLAHRFEWLSVDYMRDPQLAPHHDFSTWAYHFNQKVRAQFPRGPRVLLGYSLGGRLALQALQEAPDLYEAVVLVSTNPGLIRDKEKQDRLLADQQWAAKFLELPWSELMQSWNAQAVFKDSLSEPVRLEANYDRSQLAQALTQWSLARQPDFRDLITLQASKILWVSGEKDIKFTSLAMELHRRSLSLKTETLPKASHRVLFDQPSELAQKIISFLEESSSY